MSAAIAAVAVGVGTAAAGAYAADQAGKSQKKAGKAANQLQQAQFEQTRQDNMPWTQRGNAAGNRLQQLLGLPGGGMPSDGVMTRNDLIDTSGGEWRANADLYQKDANYRAAWDKFDANHKQRFGVGASFGRGSGLQAAQDEILGGGFDLNGYNATTGKAQQQQIQSDPEYGSLMKDITRADIEADPVYSMGAQFGLDEGRKGLERMAAATGGQQSGTLLKALSRFGNDYATTKAGDGWNRIMSGRQNKFNMLSGIAGTGQASNAQTQQAGMNMANNVSSNLIGMGNARAASQIGMGNAVAGGISGAYGAYQGNKLLDIYRQRIEAGGK